MTPDEILSHPARALTQKQREHYFEHGYVGVDDLVPADTLAELVSVTDEFVQASRKISESDNVFDIAPEHSAEKPVLRRLKMPDENHAAYWNFASGLMADVAADLAGPDVVFHHSKLNFKWFDASDSVKWHQDTQFFPHTNYNVFTIGCYLADTDMQNGPLGVLPGSHGGPIYDLYDDAGNWTGHLKDRDSASIDMSKVEYLKGHAGTLTIHNCRTAHFSPPSKSAEPRPLLLNCYSSADAKPYTPHPQPSANSFQIVRGQQAKWAHLDPTPCLIPPDWSGGYTSIYAAQAGEDEPAGTM